MIARRKHGCVASVMEGLEGRIVLTAIPLPVIPSAVFNITAYGASSTAANNTTAIQNCINAASAAGGGIVEIPAASQPYECGPLTLANKIDLQIDSGATLQMLAYGTYPVISGGTTYANFIQASNLSNVEVSGSGTIDGQGSAWWTAFNANNSVARPYGMISFSACTDIAVIGITLTNPPNTHIDFSNECTNVTINGITINTPVSPNTDGIDMSAENAIIENSSIADGDDNIAIGGTAGQASNNVTIINDSFGIGHGLSIGSYTTGGVDNLVVTDCTFNGTTAGIRLKSERGRGGLVENLSYSNITMTNVEYPININSYYEDGSVPTTPTDPAQTVTSTTPIWQNITISNLISTTTSSESNYSGSYCGIIWGLPEEPVNGVTLSNVQLTARYGMDLNHVRGVTFDSTCKITPASGNQAEISTYNGASPDTPYDVVVTAANYTGQDIGSPTTTGNPLFNPDTDAYSILAGGTGIGGMSDQFSFASTLLTGNSTYIAKVTSLTNSNAAATAGVMFRDSTDTATSAFAGVFVTPSDGVEFEWRASNGVTAATPITVSSVAAPQWVKLVRSGSSFTAYYSSNGTSWTQIGSTSETVTMSNTALVGLAVAADSSSATTTAGFSNLSGPAITTAAAASPQPATGIYANLSVTATESGSTLIYIWSVLLSPSGVTAPTFSANSTSTANNTTATFYAAGIYEFLLTVTDSNNVSTTTILGVGVNQTPTTVTISPASASLGANGTKLFTASATDQFGATFEPVFSWLLASGVGSENSSFGFYTAPATAGSATVKATAGSASGTASVTIGPIVSSAATANPNPVSGTSTVLTATGTENGSGSGLTYTWSYTGPSGITYSGNTNGSTAASNITANFTKAGSYNFTVTITDSGGLTATSQVAVTVNQTPTGVVVSPASTVTTPGGTAQFTATATDQFGNAINSPSFNWSITGTASGNSINSSGLASLGSTQGNYTVTASLGLASNTAQVTVNAAPAVTAFQVNDGNVQRSMVDSLTVTFNQAVTLGSSAIALNQLETGGGTTPMSFSQNSPDGGTTWVLTFTNPSYIGGSLPDGAYALTITGSAVSNSLSQTMSGTTTENFYRFYGDFEGTGVVDIGDFNIFSGVFGLPTPASLWYVDYNNDGVIDITDFNAFSQNFGLPAPMPSVVTTTTNVTTTKTIATTTVTPATTITTPAPTSTKTPVKTLSTLANPPTPPASKNSHRSSTLTKHPRTIE